MIKVCLPTQSFKSFKFKSKNPNYFTNRVKNTSFITLNKCKPKKYLIQPKQLFLATTEVETINNNKLTN